MAGRAEREPALGWNFEQGAEIVPGRLALKRLGGGDRYEAYFAWDQKLFSQVVVKMLRPNVVAEERALQTIAKEAELLARLNHPVIVRLFDAELEGARPHIVMEHIEGPTLSSLLKRHGPLPLEQLLPLILQLCSALHYLHGEEVVHLDVKPRNIIMSAPARLIDLSVARTVERAARLKSNVGTDAYMAPEQCDPEQLGPVRPPADVWGLGATLHHAATGKKPFPREDDRGDEPRDRFPQLERDPEPWPPGAPTGLEDLTIACMARDPAARPVPTEIAALVEPWLAELPRRPTLRRTRPRI